MKPILRSLAGIALAISALPAVALELGPEDFLAARNMTCVLAQESLGYLSEDEFAGLAETIMADYDQAGGDVVYAKAIGYFDGLMFGLPADDERAVNERLQEFLSSNSCRRLTAMENVSQPF